MKKILVLGAGLVAGAHVRYLLDQPDFHVTVASRTLSKAQDIIGGHPKGEARQLDVTDEVALEDLIRQTDLVVSLLPYVYHPLVARLCVKYRKHMVTTSYVKEPMAQLDGAAKEAGVILLNEIGVDPGIDHMTAMKVIHRVQKDGGEITSFTSWCGGLPAPEANTNPFGYKFSWSPKGVLLAGKNSAHYLRDGKEVFVPGEELFDHYWIVPVEVEGEMMDFEGYPNRDSLPYMEIYGITTTKNMFRGTLRYVGWCPTLRKIVDLGLLDEEERDDIAGLTFAQFTARLIDGSTDTLKKDLAAYLEVEEDSLVINNLEWLGLMSDDPLPLQKGAPIDILTARMLEKMQYEEGERDMLILQHEFLAEYPNPSTALRRGSGQGSGQRRKEKITSTMVDFGIPHGDTSMSRTVGLPAAIGVRLILQGKVNLTGVHTSVAPEIYEPVLEELEQLGIHFTEKWETLEG
jgi:saccharopine dehydrogenase (NADP+, L-glutamate forming)